MSFRTHRLAPFRVSVPVNKTGQNADSIYIYDVGMFHPNFKQKGRGITAAAPFLYRYSVWYYFIVGMTNSAPSFTPEGQRDVTVFVLV